MLPLGRVCKQPLRSLTRICQNSKFKIGGYEGKKGRHAMCRPFFGSTLGYERLSFVVNVIV